MRDNLSGYIFKNAWRCHIKRLQLILEDGIEIFASNQSGFLLFSEPDKLIQSAWEADVKKMVIAEAIRINKANCFKVTF